jgi:hypothetical protein
MFGMARQEPLDREDVNRTEITWMDQNLASVLGNVLSG